MLKKSLLKFYVLGREARLLPDEVDVEQLALGVLNRGGSVRDAAYKAAETVGDPHRTGRSKTRWIREEETEIADAGADPEGAYSQFMQGRIDSLACAIEHDLVEELMSIAEDPEAFSQADGQEMS
jgi:hypothetical protein